MAKKEEKKHKPDNQLKELEKYHAGEAFDSSKMYDEMDEAFWEKTMEGLREGSAPAPNGQTNPPSEPGRPA